MTFFSRLNERPYNLLFFSAIIVFIAGYLLSGNSTLDIHMHDTYVVLPAAYYAWVPALLLLVAGVFYFIARNVLYSKRLSWIHIGCTIFICLFLVLMPFLSGSSYEGLAGMPRRYFDYSSSDWTAIFSRLPITTIIILLTGACVQLIFVVNLAIGLWLRLKK
ncbi:MAG: hypothetical protein QM731_01420 [Chitinophagaceae bacterium]